MKVVTVDEAKIDLSRLIQEALEGEAIVIARGNDPWCGSSRSPRPAPSGALAGSGAR